jgi:hypothetical protein
VAEGHVAANLHLAGIFYFAQGWRLSFWIQADGIHGAWFRGFLATAGIAFLRADHPGFIILEFKDLRTEVHTGAAAYTGFLIDNRGFHGSPPEWRERVWGSLHLSAKNTKKHGKVLNPLLLITTVSAT